MPAFRSMPGFRLMQAIRSMRRSCRRGRNRHGELGPFGNLSQCFAGTSNGCGNVELLVSADRQTDPEPTNLNLFDRNGAPLGTYAGSSSEVFEQLAYLTRGLSGVGRARTSGPSAPSTRPSRSSPRPARQANGRHSSPTTRSAAWSSSWPRSVASFHLKSRTTTRRSTSDGGSIAARRKGCRRPIGSRRVPTPPCMERTPGPRMRCSVRSRPPAPATERSRRSPPRERAAAPRSAQVVRHGRERLPLAMAARLLPLTSPAGRRPISRSQRRFAASALQSVGSAL
jgi:hypothetical protein